MKTEYEMEKAMEQYADLVARICFCRLKHKEDSEDVFQNVFLKYMMTEKEFDKPEYEKAWIIRVTINECKDIFRNLFRQRTVGMDELSELSENMDETSIELLDALSSLPVKYRDVLYLHYYEGYNAREIGDILSKKEGSVYSLLSRGRDMLKEQLGGEWNE